MTARIVLKPEPLTKAAFAPFGDVIEIDAARARTINQGMATRYHDLAGLDLLEARGTPLVNIFRGKPWPMPMPIKMVERHPLSSQAFIPLSAQPFLMVVAAPAKRVAPGDLRAFLARGGQGVNYRRGVWHHPLIALDRVCDFLVIDRGGADENCDERFFDEADGVIELTL